MISAGHTVTDLPPIDLLNSTHEFPTTYTMKVIGRADDDFVARVVAVVRDELGPVIEIPFRTKETSGGRHVSVTLEPEMQSAEQVLAVYQRLGETSGVVLLL
jgi:hypothetical protein